MDFGELGQDADEKAIIPTYPFQLAAHGAFARLQPGQIQRQLPQQGQVLRAIPLPVPRLILVAGHIQLPVQPIFNPPMPPHNVVDLFALGPVLPLDGGHFVHGGQARPVMRFLQPSHIGADAGNAGFNTPVSLADLDILGQRRGHVIQKQLRIIPQRTLVALQSQGVVAALAQSPAAPLDAGSARHRR